MLNVDIPQFDEWASDIYEKVTHRVLSHTVIKNTKRVVRAGIKDTRKLYNRVAHLENKLYYNLGGKVVETTSEGWKVVEQAT